MKDNMHRYVMICIIILLGLNFVHSIAGVALAATEWEVLKTLSLEEKPLDVAVSLDGTKAYILGNKNIFIYATDRGEVVDKIPLKDEFSQISISPDGESLYLTNSNAKQISVIRISTIFTIETGNSPVIGNPKAPTHIVAFLDYQCPYCTSMFPILTQLLDKYPQQVNLIIKHFPLRMHRSAEKAALACLAAAKQNKYKELSDLYFKNYTQLNDETIKIFAQQAGLNMAAFDKDREDASLKSIITEDMNLGRKLGFRGVPAVFINGRFVKGRTLEALSQMVEQEIKK